MPTKKPVINIEKYFSKFVERANEVFWVRSKDYKNQLYINPAYEIVWGRTCESIYKYPEKWNDFLHPDDRKIMEQSIGKRKPDTNPDSKFLQTYRIIRPNGEIRWIKDSSFPIYDDNGEHIGFAGVAEDITDIKRYEESLKKAKEKAEIANESKTEFIMNMSHDIRTPLNGILAYAEVLSKKEKNAAKKEMLTDMHISAKSLLGLLNSILEITDIEKGRIPVKKSKINLKQLINDSTCLLKSEAKRKKINLELAYDSKLPDYIISDPIRIQRIILNLLGNAIKFTSKGTVTISIKLKNIKNKKVLNIQVEDTGPGIPEDKKDAIFEKFTRLGSSYKGDPEGSGLGLYIVKRFVDDLSGNIVIESPKKKGTIFICSFPVTIA